MNYTLRCAGEAVDGEDLGEAGWGLSWSYDGWGNRLAQTVTKGYAPATSLTVDAATNRISAASNWLYDNNGNATQAGAGMPLTYDVENRLLTAVGEQYGYAPDNKRVWQKAASGAEKVTFWLGDRALARYTVETSSLTLDRELAVLRRAESVGAAGPGGVERRRREAVLPVRGRGSGLERVRISSSGLTGGI